MNEVALIVRSHVHRVDPLVVFWELVSPDVARVEREILRLQFAPDIVQSEFRHPSRVYIDGARHWRSIGYTVEERNSSEH